MDELEKRLRRFEDNLKELEYKIRRVENDLEAVLKDKPKKTNDLRNYIECPRCDNFYSSNVETMCDHLETCDGLTP